MGQYTERGYEFDQSAVKIQEIFDTVLAFMKLGGLKAMGVMMQDITTLQDAVDNLQFAAMGIVETINFDMSKMDWEYHEDEEGKYPFHYTIKSEKADKYMIPFVLFSEDSLDDAARFRVSVNSYTDKGIVLVKSKLKPDTDMTGVCYIIGPGGYNNMPVADEDTLGGVMIGDGVQADARGKLSVDTDSVASDVASKTQATDAAVDAMIKEVFGDEEDGE